MGGRSLAAFGAAIVVVGALMVASPKSARAATTLTVASTSDSDVITPCVSGTCLTLRDAIAQANSDNAGDVISLAANAYSLTDCSGSNGGALDVDVAMTIQGTGSGKVTIEGGTCDGTLSTAWDSSLIEEHDNCVDLTVTGVTLTAGFASGTSEPSSGGGAISVDCGDPTLPPSLTLNDVDVLSNVANGQGGGVRLTADMNVSMTNVTFASNKAGTEGGGFYADPCCDNVLLAISLNNLYVHDNTAGCPQPPQGTVKSVLECPSSGNGGGLFLTYNDAPAATPSITGSNLLISTNTAVDGNGGGMFLSGFPVLDAFSAVTLTGNRATGVNEGTSRGWGGGAVLEGNEVTASFTNTTATGNIAGDHGGGFALIGIESPNLTLLNATVNGNTAGATGGGGAIASNTGNVKDATVTQSILNGNKSGSSPALDECVTIPPEYDVGVTSGDWNLSDDDTCDLDGTHDNNATANVDLGALGANTWSGGPPTVGAAVDSTALTTEALLTGSPAIDAIPAGTCPPPKPDERGVPRPQNATGLATVNCDIGAFEVLPVTPAAPTPTSGVEALTTPVPNTGVSESSAASGYVMLALGGALLIGGVASTSRRRRRLG